MNKIIASIQNKLPMSKSYASCTCFEDRIELKTWFDGVFQAETDYNNKIRTIYIKDIVSVVVQEPQATFDTKIFGYIQFHVHGASESIIESRANYLYKRDNVSKVIDKAGMLLTFSDKENQVIIARRIKDYVEEKSQEMNQPQMIAPQQQTKTSSSDVNSNKLLDELTTVVSMFEKGLLTKEEFVRVKREILGYSSDSGGLIIQNESNGADEEKSKKQAKSVDVNGQETKEHAEPKRLDENSGKRVVENPVLRDSLAPETSKEICVEENVSSAKEDRALPQERLQEISQDAFDSTKNLKRANVEDLQRDFVYEKTNDKALTILLGEKRSLEKGTVSNIPITKSGFAPSNSTSQQKSFESRVKVCPNCKQECPVNLSSCPLCGAPLLSVPPQRMQQPECTTERKSSVPLVIVVVLVVLVACYYLLLQPNVSNEDVIPTSTAVPTNNVTVSPTAKSTSSATKRTDQSKPPAWLLSEIGYTVKKSMPGQDVTYWTSDEGVYITIGLPISKSEIKPYVLIDGRQQYKEFSSSLEELNQTAWELIKHQGYDKTAVVMIEVVDSPNGNLILSYFNGKQNYDFLND